MKKKYSKSNSYKKMIKDGLQEAIFEVKRIKEGKLKGIPAKDLLKEL